MMKTLYISAALVAAISTSAIAQQAPGGPPEGAILEMIARMVIDKYRTSSCEDLRSKKGGPPSEVIAQGTAFMRDHPEAHVRFINMIAAPVANRMFECGMIP